jgi:hypothetical protein
MLSAPAVKICHANFSLAGSYPLRKEYVFSTQHTRQVCWNSPPESEIMFA